MVRGRVAQNQRQKCAVRAHVSPSAARYRHPGYVDILPGSIEIIVFFSEIQYTIFCQQNVNAQCSRCVKHAEPVAHTARFSRSSGAAAVARRTRLLTSVSGNVASRTSCVFIEQPLHYITTYYPYCALPM